MTVNDLKVTWYGERGIVNSIVVGLQRAGVSNAIALLNAIQWANGVGQSWISKIQSIELIVEVGCSHFGNPDLIMVCRTDEERPYCIFIEAKVIGYEDSAKSNKTGIDNNKQFNSSINGQLSLKYRMALALSQWNDSIKHLIEPNCILEAYKKPFSDDGQNNNGLNDQRKKPRRLIKQGVLNLLRNAGLKALPLSQFRFVALTWDSKAYFENDDFHQSEYRPLFLDMDGNECWKSILGQVGWVGFSKLNEPQIVKHLGEDFTNACKTMLEGPEPARIEGEDFELIGNTPSSKDDHNKFEEIIKAIAKDNSEVIYNGEGNKIPGVLTIKAKHRSKGRIKVVLETARVGGREVLDVFLGVSASMGKRTWAGYPFDECRYIQKKDFRYIFRTRKLPSDLKEAEEIIHSVIDDFIGDNREPDLK